MTSDNALESGLVTRVRAAMAVRDVSIRDLASTIGLPYRTLQNYLLGTNQMPAKIVGKVAEALNVSSDFFLLGRVDLFDMRLLSDTLHLVEDWRRHGGDKVSLDDAAALFAADYNRDYQRQFEYEGMEPPLQVDRGIALHVEPARNGSRQSETELREKGEPQGSKGGPKR